MGRAHKPSSQEIILTDESVWTLGSGNPIHSHKGKLLKDIPAQYLYWMEGNIRKKIPPKRTPLDRAILTYIDNNRDRLDKMINIHG